MLKYLHQVTVETDIGEDVIYITQDNQYHNDGKDSIVLDPCQIDLLIKILQHAKEEFIGNTNVAVPVSNSVMVNSK